jgi:hypothetical protein
MQLYSPSVKMVKQSVLDGMISYPVFGDHDKVEGKIMLDPTCSQSGRLVISVRFCDAVTHGSLITSS